MKFRNCFGLVKTILIGISIVLFISPLVKALDVGDLSGLNYSEKEDTFPIILTWDYNIYVMGPAEIKQFVQLAKEKNIDQINLRINNKGVINARIDHGTVYRERLDAFGEDFDPLRVLVEEGHKAGLRVGVHFDLTNFSLVIRSSPHNLKRIPLFTMLFQVTHTRKLEITCLVGLGTLLNMKLIKCFFVQNPVIHQET